MEIRIAKRTQQGVDAPEKVVLCIVEISEALLDPLKQVERVNLAFRLCFRPLTHKEQTENMWIRCQGPIFCACAGVLPTS